MRTEATAIAAKMIPAMKCNPRLNQPWEYIGGAPVRLPRRKLNAAQTLSIPAMTAPTGCTAFTGLTKHTIVQSSIESIIAQISQLAKAGLLTQISTCFDSVYFGSNRKMAILRQSRLPLYRQAGSNFHAVERFESYLFRAGRGEEIIERCFVPASAVRVLKAPCLHILHGCSLQQRRTRHRLNARWFTAVCPQSETQLHDSSNACLAGQWRMLWYVRGYQYRFVLCCHDYRDSDCKAKRCTNTDDHRYAAFRLKIVRGFAVSPPWMS
jgi:hypothetical protein